MLVLEQKINKFLIATFQLCTRMIYLCSKRSRQFLQYGLLIEVLLCLPPSFIRIPYTLSQRL